jgi:hypothetical protein
MRYHNALHRDSACVDCHGSVTSTGFDGAVITKSASKDCTVAVFTKSQYLRCRQVTYLCEHLQSSHTNSKMIQSHPSIVRCITREQWCRKLANPPESADSVEQSCSAVCSGVFIEIQVRRTPAPAASLYMHDSLQTTTTDYAEVALTKNALTRRWPHTPSTCCAMEPKVEHSAPCPLDAMCRFTRSSRRTPYVDSTATTRMVTEPDTRPPSLKA